MAQKGDKLPGRLRVDGVGALLGSASKGNSSECIDAIPDWPEASPGHFCTRPKPYHSGRCPDQPQYGTPMTLQRGAAADEPTSPAPRRRIQSVIDRVLFWLVLASLMLCCLAWSLPAVPLRYALPRRMRAPVGQFTAMLWCRCFVGVMQATGRVRCNLHALDVLRTDKNLIIACNHPSLIDAPLIISRLPHVTCIAKAALWDNPFFGAGIRLAGYVRNDTPRQLLRRAAIALQCPGPGQMLIFPEGTRSPRGQVGPFLPGFAAIAHRAGADVQTVFIETNSAYMSKGWPIFRMPVFPVTYDVRLGRRFTPSGAPKSFAAQLEAYFRADTGVPGPSSAISDSPEGTVPPAPPCPCPGQAAASP